MRTGGCLCGAVRFEVDGDPMLTRACWCRACQYWASGNAALNAMFPSAGFRLSGQTAEYRSTADSGTAMVRRFCPKCGTQITSEALSRPHLVVLRIGALDETLPDVPQATIWTASAPPWACIDATKPQFEGQPPPPAPPKG